MKNLNIRQLDSGGLITNYYCTSQCRHCLYACSPRWEKKYIDTPMARNIYRKIIELGCFSIHIGGGEPFLDIDGLKQTIRAAYEENMRIEYVETNSSWYRDHDSAVETLRALKNNGLTTVLVSISPFHNEYVPFRKVKGVMEACREAEIRIFPWVENFYDDIDSFDEHETHGLNEYLEAFGQDYLRRVPSRVWMHMGGRAITLFQDILPRRDTGEIIENSGACNELTDVSHFHFDCFGNYIPALCTGLTVRYEDMGSALDPERYPFLSMLYDGGVASLLEYARKEHDFIPQQSYISKCHLCLDIRKYLVFTIDIKSPDLGPEEFYLFV